VNDVPLAGSERPRPATHRLIGPVEAGQEIGVTLVVRPRPGSPALPDLEYWQATPPGRRRFLSPEEYARVHGAAQDDLDLVGDFAAARGLTVTSSDSGRRSVGMRGTAERMAAAFGITLNHYEAPYPWAPRARTAGAGTDGASAEPTVAQTYVHHGYDGAVSLPLELSGVVLAVVGLDNRRVSIPAGGTGDPSGAGYDQVPAAAQHYDFPAVGAAGQTIGVFAPNPASYLRTDLTNYYFPNLSNASYRTPPAAFNDISLTVGGTTYSNDPSAVQAVTSSTPNSVLNSLPDSYILELTQDISTSATIAQGATVNVYFSEDSEQGWLTFLNRVLVPEGEPQPTVVTCSFLLARSDDTQGPLSSSSSPAAQMTAVFQALAALGVEVFIALGDWGSDDEVIDGHVHVSYPSSDQWVTSCGGTIIGTSEEVVWSDAWSTTSNFGGDFANPTNPNSDFGATGGGVSALFHTAPPYQTAAGITGAKDSSGATHTGRGVPDVAGMVAFDGFYVNGVSYSFTGTSCVAPLYAGLAAVLRSAFGITLGFLNPTLYQLRDSAFNDITYGNNDSGDTPAAPYFTAGTGWDACTGLGSIKGTELVNGIAALLYQSNFYFQVNKGTFGLDEVAVNASYPVAMWLVLEGYTPDAVTAAGVAPTVTAVPGITVTVGPAEPEIASQPSTPQRILFPCMVSFAGSAINTTAHGGIFPPPGNPPTPVPVTLVAQPVTIGGQSLSARTTIELEPGADPFFANFNWQAGFDTFYLSQDLRVFTVIPGVDNAPIDGIVLDDSGHHSIWDTGGAYAYIQALLAHLNSKYDGPSQPDAFGAFPDQSGAASGDSSVVPYSAEGHACYNFAVARVRLGGTPNSSSGANVRVLFRLFATETSDTDYQSSSYPATVDNEGQPLKPELGSGWPAPVTIPFFATGNYQANADYQANVDYSGTSINNQPIAIGPDGEAYAYYGCYLNLYPNGQTIDGKKVQSLLPSTHSCIVAQVVYDDAPMPTGPGLVQGPEYTTNFAQRNLQITYSDNPGPAATHRVPQTFDVRPGPAPGTGPLEDYPDEMMIDWGQIPAGSVASIYWPQVAAADVLTLASELYSTHQLSAADAHTIQCTVPEGFTFVPIPAGTGAGGNFAGLFTVDLPAGITAGQEFTVTVRRLSTWQATRQPPPPPPIQLAGQAAADTAGAAGTAGKANALAVGGKGGQTMLNWRYVVGTFAVRIPVTTARTMLPWEENTLAIMKWRLSQLEPTNRWVPVLTRYVDYIAARVQGLGGRPNAIQPSQWGTFEPKPSAKGRRTAEYTGKVEGLTYDRFGDFEGFLLLTETGDAHVFRSREAGIQALARFAWEDRVLITVLTGDEARDVPASIILRRAPERWAQ
jgi:Pro-kumamolisin, activation domain